ncbi:MAG: hypothetical protein PWP64_548 [Candidatus Cloacimonadota bacterium]|nr:hypothetical protein [Candidatus Cloacimonadota bacterium]
MALQLAGNSFRKLIYRLGGEKYKRFIHVFFAWNQLVGELLAERSHPLKIEHDVLFVGVQNSAWMQELILLKDDILKKYKNKFGEELQDIIFIIYTVKKREK